MNVTSKRVNAAWQFLRRNAEYRADHAEFFHLKIGLELEYGLVQSWTERALLNEPRAWHYWPPKKPSDSEDAWRIRAVCEGYEPRKALIHKGYARRWGLVEMVNPDQVSSKGVHFLPEQAPPIWHRVEDIEVEPLDEDPGVPAIFFARLDASKSATRQLAALRKALVAQQRRLKKHGLSWRTSLHPEKWPLYLRILDAFAAGATAKEIANVEFPHLADQYPEYAGQARVRATYEQASALVRDGYRHILLADE